MQQLYGNSNLSECDKDWDRMVQEAEQFIVAGSETTGHTLSVTMFHITQDTEVQTRLRQELVDAKISFDTSPDIAELQNLPYLVCLPLSTVDAFNPTVIFYFFSISLESLETNFNHASLPLSPRA